MQEEQGQVMTIISTQKLIQDIPNDDDTRRKLAHHTIEQWDLHQVFEYAVDTLQQKYEESSNLFDEDLEFYCEDVMDHGVYGNEVSTVNRVYYGTEIGNLQEDPARLFPQKVYSLGLKDGENV